MGRAYRYQCDRCGYRADVCGAQVDAPGFQITTIHCKECRTLFDVLSRIELDRPISEGIKDAQAPRFIHLPESRWTALEN